MASLPEHLMPTPVGRERLPRAVVAAHQRRRILPVAIEVFAGRGYQGTTVNHIVTAAKIGVGSFYSHFSGKEECFLAAYDDVATAARERIEASLPTAARPPEQACAALRALLALIATEPAAARLVLIEAQTAGPAGLARFEATLDGVAPALRRCREASPAAARLPDSLELATLAGAVWFLQRGLDAGDPQDPAAALPELVEIVLEPYLGAEHAGRLLAAV